MQNGEGNGASFMDRIKGFGKNVGQAAEEQSVIFGATKAKDVITDTAVKGYHRASEAVTSVGGALNNLGNVVDQGVQRVGDMGAGMKRAAQYDLNKDVVGAEVGNIGLNVLSKIQDMVQKLAPAQAWIATQLNDRLVPILKAAGSEKDVSFKYYNAFDNRSTGQTESGQRSKDLAAKKIEGSSLIGEIVGPLKAAADFDGVKGEAAVSLVKQALGNTEFAKKAGPKLFDALVTVVAESVNLGNKSESALAGLDELLGDPDNQDELDKQNITKRELIGAFRDAVKDISEKRKLVIESRGEMPGVSWGLEKSLVNVIENAEAEINELGFDVLSILPDTADQLNNGNMVAARIKALSLSRKTNNEVTKPLQSIAENMKKRFPDKVDQIDEALEKATESWMESKGVARALIAETKIDASTDAEVSEDIYSELIDSSKLFKSVTEEQQAEIAKALGVEATADGGHDRIEGSLFSEVCRSYGEYLRLSAAYEQVKAHVEENPEAADILMVLAERVLQAKSVAELGKHKMDAQIIVQTWKVRNSNESTAQKQGDFASEKTVSIGRKEYYSKILDRYNNRVQSEKDMIDRVIKYMGVAGLAMTGVVAGVEIGPEAGKAIWEAVKAMIAFLAENTPMTLKTGATATGSVLAVKVLSMLRSGIGSWAGRRAEKQESKAKEEKKASLPDLEAAYKNLQDLGMNEAADKVREAIDKLKGNAS